MNPEPDHERLLAEVMSDDTGFRETLLGETRRLARRRLRRTCRPAAALAMVARGDEMACRVFYQTYFDRLWRYLLVVAAGNDDVAREALQVTLLHVIRQIRIFQSEGAFWSWLTVLTRSSLNEQVHEQCGYPTFLNRFAHPAGNPVPDYGQAEGQLRTLLQHHMASLPPEDRQLVEWKYMGQRSARRIAVRLHTTEKAVESQLARIRRKLKEAVLDGLRHESQD